MNKMKTLTRSSQPSAQPCPCGCADCPDDACTLACLERPNFFYGQTLRDDDLTKLVEYTRDRLALERFRDGWGVVCGLHVDIHPEEAGVVTVNPGYAIDCCGNDVVLCDPTPIDLTSVLPEIADCRQPAVRDQDDEDVVSVLRQRVLLSQLHREVEVPRKELQPPQLYVIDIYLKHDEQKADPRTTLARGQCRDGVSCEYSRVVEKARLYPILVESPVEDDLVEPWLAKMRGCSDAVLELTKRVEVAARLKSATRDSMNNVIDSIKSWLRDNPPHEVNLAPLLDMMQRIESLIRSDVPASEILDRFASLLYMIVVDCINYHLRCLCHACADERGLRLARVIVWEMPGLRGSNPYSVLVIDNQPPIRRALAPAECYPAPRGRINIGPIVWRHPDDAKVWLARQGVKAHVVDMRYPRNWAELRETVAALGSNLKARLFADPSLEVPFDIYQLDAADIGLGQRVVLFGVNKELKREADVEPGNVVDDLTLIKGIAEARRKKLADAGITSFARLAQMTPDEIVALLQDARVTPDLAETWIETARERANK